MHHVMLYRKSEMAPRRQRQDIQKEQVLIEFAVAQQMKLKEMVDSLVARLEHEEGQDMIEYALLAALISIVAIAVIILVGPYLRNLFQDVVNALGSA
jgi:pilus assembly protein Flp/PilA